MKTKIVSCVGLVVAVASLCLAQTPSPTSSAQSSWQLAPPFELGSPQRSPAGSSSAPPATTAAPQVQTAPTQPPRSESTPPPPAQIRKTSSDASYVEGSIWIMTFVRTKAGFGDDYLKSIAASLKPIYDEEKNQKIILDYKILTGELAGDHDANIVIMVEYPNMAALERLRERTEPIIDKIIGPADKRRDLAAKRLDLREILATKTMREIWLK